MKKVGIITITANENYGNRLQNYALQEYLKLFDIDVETVWPNKFNYNFKKNVLYFLKLFNKKYNCKYLKYKRIDIFSKFTSKYIDYKIIKSKESLNNYSNLVIGSDQVFNPNVMKSNPIIPYSIGLKKSFTYASSFGIDEFDESFKKYLKKIFNTKSFNKISIREKSGAEVLSNILNRNDIVNLIDPTLLLDVNDWNKIVKKPKKKIDNYVLCYFLGNNENKVKIEEYARKNNLKIVNLLDFNDDFYLSDPSEFLYLEKNAKMIFTDSFHSSVFAFIFKTPLIIFNRVDNNEKMNSRLYDFVDMFELDCLYDSSRNFDDYIFDYSKGYNVLKKEKDKSYIFLKQALRLDADNDEK